MNMAVLNVSIVYLRCGPPRRERGWGRPVETDSVGWSLSSPSTIDPSGAVSGAPSSCASANKRGTMNLFMKHQFHIIFIDSLRINDAYTFH